ncbi:hypothetical protein MTP99_016709 [Tenebrio molitor]|nr:hypothetical protein MTP99_016709 [Tenebrio molitor]
MEPQNQEIVASGSPAEVPNDPGKMFIGGLSWQTSPAPGVEALSQTPAQALQCHTRPGVPAPTDYTASAPQKSIVFLPRVSLWTAARRAPGSDPQGCRCNSVGTPVLPGSPPPCPLHT